MMKRRMYINGAVALLGLLMAMPAWGAGLYYEGHRVETDVPPMIVENRTLIPLKTLEAMGDVVVDWQEARQTAVVLTGTAEEVTALAVPIGSSRAYQMTGTVADFEAIGVSTDNIDWDRVQIITLDVPAQIVEGRTMVPLRLISEALGYKVTWDAITQTVLVEPALAAEGDDTFDAALF